MRDRARFTEAGSPSPGRRKNIVLCAIILSAVWILSTPDTTQAWNQIFVNGACNQTGRRCRATITNAGGNNACCDPRSARISVCISQNKCRGIYGFHWPKMPVSWTINLNGMAGKSGFSKLNGAVITDTFQKVWNAWSNASCTSFEHKFLGVSKTKPNPFDKKVVLYLPTDKEWAQLGIGKGVLAFSNPTPNSKGALTDGDIVFNPKPGASWGAHPNVDKIDLDLAATAIHEIGHTLGLGHSHLSTAVMYFSIRGRGPVYRGLGADDQNAICTLYPTTNQCKTSTECGPCRTCKAGTCQLSNALQAQTCKVCTTDQSCAPNSQCVNGPAGKRCLQRCVQSCCPSGYRCSTVGNTDLCTPITSQCPDVKCTKDSDCGGGKCLRAKGVCIAPNPPYSPQQCNRKCSVDKDCAPSHKCVERIPGQKYCAPECNAGALCPKNLHCIPTANKGNVCTPSNPFFCPCGNNADCPFGQTCNKGICQSIDGEVQFAPCSGEAPCKKGLQCLRTSSGNRCVQPCNPGKCPLGTTCQKITTGASVCIGTASRGIGQSCDDLQFRCDKKLTCVLLRPDALSGYCVEICSLSQGCKSGGACNQSSTNLRYCQCGPKGSCGVGRTCRTVGSAPNQIKLCVCSGPSCPDLCNNQVCDSAQGENCSNCADDCRCRTGERCLKGVCLVGNETCGNGTCEQDENCSSCAKDCSCPKGQKCLGDQCRENKCGNNVCDTNDGENCSNCVKDCSCKAGTSCKNARCIPSNSSCGNGTCESNESCSNCAADCPCPAGQTCQNGSCKATDSCGNNTCDTNENCETCPADCACGAGRQCKAGVCRSDGTVDICGNKVCEINVGENCSTCESDCRCPPKHICQAGICRQANTLCPPEQQKEVCDAKGVCKIECELKGCSCDQTQSPNLPTGLLILLFGLFLLTQRRKHRASHSA